MSGFYGLRDIVRGRALQGLEEKSKVATRIRESGKLRFLGLRVNCQTYGNLRELHYLSHYAPCIDIKQAKTLEKS